MIETALHIDTARNAVAKGDLLMAQQQYAAALAQYRDDYQTMFEFANLLFATDRLDAAIAAAHRAVKLAPSSYQVWHNYGWYLGVAGRYEEAMMAFKQSLSLEPAYASFFALGLCRYSIGKFEDAILDFTIDMDVRIVAFNGILLLR